MKILAAIFALTLFTFAADAQTVSRNGRDNSRPRVFIEESDSWEIKEDTSISTTRGRRGRDVTVMSGSTKGGAKPRTAEIMKRFSEECSNCIVTMYRDKADFIVRLDHEGGKDIFNKDNKLAVFNREGDMIASGSFSRTKKAVEVACEAINSEYNRQGRY